MPRLFGALAGCVLLLVWTGCDEWPGLNGSNDGGVSSSSGGGSRIDDTSGQVGSSCTSSGGGLTGSSGGVTCTSGLTCSTGFPGGLCTRACQSNSDCNGGVCVPSAQGLLCMKSCVSDQTCRAGYSCVADGASSSCQPGASTNTNFLDAGLD